MESRVRPAHGADLQNRPLNLSESFGILLGRYLNVNHYLRTHPLQSKLTQLYHSAWERALHTAIEL